MTDRPFVYLSYSRVDRDFVAPIAQEIANLGIDVWIDFERLMAGDSWEARIEDALAKTTTLVFFVSHTSMRSDWVRAELAQAVANGARVIPVLIDRVPVDQMPLSLRKIQWLDATAHPPDTAAKSVAAEIVRIVSGSTPGIPGSLLKGAARDAARAFAAQSKGEDTRPPRSEAPTSVFVVHGHDEDMLNEVVQYIETLGVKAIVLKNVGGASRSLMADVAQPGRALKTSFVALRPQHGP